MNTLTIKDLPASEELGRKAMSAVRGGMIKAPYPHWMPYYSNESKFSLNAEQLIGQTQNVTNMNGNNVAFATDIRSVVKPHQTANNSISF